jgi:hypothetical protein
VVTICSTVAVKITQIIGRGRRPNICEANFASLAICRHDPFVLVKAFVYGQSGTPVPTVYGGNRLFHHSGVTLQGSLVQRELSAELTEGLF